MKTSRSPRNETPEEKIVRMLEGVRRLLLAGLVAFFISIVTSVVTYINADNDDNAIDEAKQNSAEVKEFVDDLQEPDEAEIQRNAAVTRAVNLVPEIKDILCSQEAFPDAAACS